MNYPDYNNYKDLFNGEWRIEHEERNSWEFLKTLLFSGATFVDVGCQKGIYSKGVLDFLEKCSVYAFDVMRFPQMDSLLEDSRFHFTQAAVGNGEKCECTIHYDSKLIYPLDKSEKLDDLLIGVGKIDVIKIDVDGLEFEALQGAKNILLNDKPVIMVEIESSQIKFEIIKYLSSIGYLLIDIKNHINHFFEHETRFN